MSEQELLAEQFAANRDHLHAVAYRMLGSATEADDAVQEAWLRLQRSDASGIDNLGGWLTTVTGRVCLDILRARRRRNEESIDDRAPDLVVTRDPVVGPEDESMLADSVGLALLVVLDTLTPAERLAFVLHDMFAVPFDEIAVMLDRSHDAVRQLASRARRRVQGAPAVPDADRRRQREAVDAFFAAARDGDFDALVAVLDPDVVVHGDRGAGAASGPTVTRGAEAVARQAMRFANPRATLNPVLVDGTPGVVVTLRGRPQSIGIFTVVEGRIVEVQFIGDRDRIARLDLSALDA